MGNDWVETHRRLKKILEEEEDCVDITDVSEMINDDIQKVRQHFEVMKIDGYGNFMDKKKKIFCSVKTPTKVFDYIARGDIEGLN